MKSYLLKNIPDKTWYYFKKRCENSGVTIRQAFMEFVYEYRNSKYTQVNYDLTPKQIDEIKFKIEDAQTSWTRVATAVLAYPKKYKIKKIEQGKKHLNIPVRNDALDFLGAEIDRDQLIKGIVEIAKALKPTDYNDPKYRQYTIPTMHDAYAYEIAARYKISVGDAVFMILCRNLQRENFKIPVGDFYTEKPELTFRLRIGDIKILEVLGWDLETFYDNREETGELLYDL